MAVTFQYPIVYVSDVTTSRLFYQHALGYVFSQGNETFTELVLDDRLLALNAAGNNRDKAITRATLLYFTDNIDDCHGRVRALTDRVNPIQITDYGRTFFFEDPDGNKIEIVESI